MFGIGASAGQRLVEQRRTTPPVAVSAARPRPGPEHVVLMHGFLGFRRLGPLTYFQGVQQALEQDGFCAHAPTVNPLQLSDYRAYQWFYGQPPGGRVQSAERLYRGPLRPRLVNRSGFHGSIAEIYLATRRPVHLIAHSQGCRDARYLLSPNGLGDWRPFAGPGYAQELRSVRIRDCVASLATVAGAHNGMLYAEDEQAPNWILRLMADRQFNRFVSLLSMERTLGGQAVRENGRSHMLAFNRRHPDPPGVRLYSVAGLTDRGQCTFFLKRFYDSLRNDPRFEREENDGLVNLSSAMWPVRDLAALERLAVPAGVGLLNDCFHGPARHGAWRFLGTVYADHVEQIGLPFAFPANRLFDHLAFYRGLAHVLAGDWGPETRLGLDGRWSLPAAA